MIKNMRKLLCTLCVLQTLVYMLNAAEQEPKTTSSSGFVKLLKLIGKWEGIIKRSNGESVFLRTEYKLIGGGASIMESWIEETAPMKEDEPMVTIYHDKAGKLTATHYCALGNAPTLALSFSSDSKIEFTFDPLCGLDPKKDQFVTKYSYAYEESNPSIMEFVGYVNNPIGKPTISKATLKKVNEWSR